MDWNVVEPGYFATLRTPIVAGRDFTIADREGTQPVAIVSEAAARQFWPGEDAIGKYLLQPTWGPQGRPTRRGRCSSSAWRATCSPAASSMVWRAPCVYVPFQQQYSVEPDDRRAHDPRTAHRRRAPGAAGVDEPERCRS